MMRVNSVINESPRDAIPVVTIDRLWNVYGRPSPTRRKRSSPTSVTCGTIASSVRLEVLAAESRGVMERKAARFPRAVAGSDSWRLDRGFESGRNHMAGQDIRLISR